MNPTRYSFVRQFAGAVVAALIPVFLVAFVSKHVKRGNRSRDKDLRQKFVGTI